jgi:hypothetical protein
MPDAPGSYPYIVAVGKYWGSKSYYIQDEIAQARRDRAPARATHRRDDGTWATIDEQIPTIRDAIIAAVEGRP